MSSVKLNTTGGSGGHTVPATIIFDHLKKNFGFPPYFKSLIIWLSKSLVVIRKDSFN